MRVIVTGGTGLVGCGVAHAMLRRGEEVVIFTRGASRDATHECKRCPPGTSLRHEHWTPEARGDWMKLVDGADAVVHLAGESVADGRWTPERKARLRSSRLASTELLVEAIHAAARKPKVLVSASGVGHYGLRTGDATVTEDSPTGDDFLAQLTKEWEAKAAPARADGVRVCHPRLGLVLGRAGGIFAKLRPIFNAFVGGPVGDGHQYVPWVHLSDVVAAIEAMIDRTDLEGAYNVVSPDPVTMNAFADALAAALRRPALFRVPAAAVKLALGHEAAEAILTGQRALPKRLTDAGFAFLFPDLASALADLVANDAA